MRVRCGSQMWQPTTAMRPAVLSSLLVSCHAASLHRAAEDRVEHLEQIFPSLTALASLVAKVEDAVLTPGPQPGVQLLHSRFGLPTPAAGAKEHSSGSAVEEDASSGDTGRDEGMFKLPPLPYAYDAL